MLVNRVMDEQLGEKFDYALLRSDMLLVKEDLSLTYFDIGMEVGCHLQSVYKFLSGERTTLGKSLRYKFVYFVYRRWREVFQVDFPEEPRYLKGWRSVSLPL